MNKLYIDGSFCPHYRCGGFAFKFIGKAFLKDDESLDGYVIAGEIPQIQSAYKAEVTALHKALILINEYRLTGSRISDKFTIVTDNQNLAARAKKENDFLFQSNYHRPPPWDYIHQLMLDLGNMHLNVTWKQFKEDEHGEQVHLLAKQAMIYSRKQIEQKYANQET